MFDDAKVDYRNSSIASISNSDSTSASRNISNLVLANVYEIRNLTFEDKVAVQIFKWFTVVFLIVGTICNLLAAIVYSRKRMRKTSYSVYLFTLAVVDICVIWTGCLRLTIMFHVDLTTNVPKKVAFDQTFINNITAQTSPSEDKTSKLAKNTFFLADPSPDNWTSLAIDDGLIWPGFDLRHTSLVACRIHRFLTYYLLQLSSLLLCMLNIDRLIGCVLILKASQFCKPRMARRIVLYTMIFLLVLNLHFLCFMGVNNDSPEGIKKGLQTSSDRNQSSYILEHQQRTRVFCEPDSRNRAYISFWHIFFYIDATLYCFLPFVIMIVCNALIIRKIIQSRKSSKKVIVKKRTQKILRHTSSGMLPAEKRLSLILIAISLSFLLFTVPVMIIEHLDDQFAPITVGWNILLAVAYMLMYLNHVINFFFYCFMGPKFRNEIKKLFPMFFPKSRHRANPSRSNTGTTFVETANGLNFRMSQRISSQPGITKSITQMQLIEKIEPSEEEANVDVDVDVDDDDEVVQDSEEIESVVAPLKNDDDKQQTYSDL